MIYTINAIESLNLSLRKVIKNRGSFPNDEVMFKLRYLALTNISKRWTMPSKNWKAALPEYQRPTKCSVRLRRSREAIFLPDICDMLSTLQKGVHV